MRSSAYLNFNGDCAEAFEFYAKTFGHDLRIMRMGDMDKTAPAPRKDQVMHAHLKIGDADIMASDTFDLKYEKPIGFYVAINVDSPSEAERIFNALTPGGTVQQALAETFFAYKFGTVVDKWGTPWMIVSQKPMGG